MNDVINHTAYGTLFTQAHTHNGWLDRPVNDAQLQTIWDLMKVGPTSANCSSAHVVFVHSAEGKEKLCPTLSSGNLQKTMQAPVIAIMMWDGAFYDRLPALFPRGDAHSWFTSSPQLAEETAFRNNSLQAAYLIFACHTLGLGAGPISSFDWEKVDATLFADNGWKSNLLVNIGYGGPGKLYSRLPRLSFDEACLLAQGVGDGVSGQNESS